MKLEVEINGQVVVRLNKKLIEKQGLTESEVSELLKLHEKRWNKLELMKTLEPTDKSRLHKIRDDITNLDFALQKVWKFPENINFHRFFELPYCSCPKIDNAESLGTPYKIIAADCPIHN